MNAKLLIGGFSGVKSQEECEDQVFCGGFERQIGRLKGMVYIDSDYTCAGTGLLFILDAAFGTWCMA